MSSTHPVKPSIYTSNPQYSVGVLFCETGFFPSASEGLFKLQKTSLITHGRDS